MKVVLILLLLTISPALVMGQPQFGTFSQAYLDRQQLKKWKEMCKGSARYQAMSEAYDARKPDPCSGAKEWRR